MATFLLVLALAFFVGWVVAEFKAGKAKRIVLGVACMASLFLGMALGHMEAAVCFAKTNMWYKQSLAYIAVLIRHFPFDLGPARPPGSFGTSILPLLNNPSRVGSIPRPPTFN